MSNKHLDSTYQAMREAGRIPVFVVVDIPHILINGIPLKHLSRLTFPLDIPREKAEEILSGNVLSQVLTYLVEKEGYSEEAAEEAIKQAIVKVDWIE